MPAGHRSADSEEEESVFQSPEWEPDQGASPQLRRSSRKRKSTAGAGDEDMTKGSSSKKSKMPKVTRSPQNPSRDPLLSRVSPLKLCY